MADVRGARFSAKTSTGRNLQSTSEDFTSKIEISPSAILLVNGYQEFNFEISSESSANTTVTTFITVIFYECLDKNCESCLSPSNMKSAGRCVRCERWFDLTEDKTCLHHNVLHAWVIGEFILFCIAFILCFFTMAIDEASAYTVWGLINTKQMTLILLFFRLGHT